MIVPFALLQILAPVACRRVSFSLMKVQLCSEFWELRLLEGSPLPSALRVHQRAWGSPSCLQSPQEKQQQQRVTSWWGISYASSPLILMTQPTSQMRRLRLQGESHAPKISEQADNRTKFVSLQAEPYQTSQHP